MKLKRHHLLLLAVLLVPANAHAQVATIAAGELVQNSIDQVKTAIDSAISNLDNAIDSNTFLATQRLRLLATELDEIAKNNVNNTFNQISKTEQKILQDALTTLNKIDATTENAANEVNRLIESTNGLLSTLPFMDSTPRIERFTPEYQVHDVNKSEIALRVSGYFLDHGDPRLSLGGKSCKVRSFTRNKAEFTCGLDKQSSDLQKVAFLAGELGLVREKSFFQKLKGFFSDTNEYKSYKIGLTRIPSKMGDYVLNATVRTTVRETKSRSQRFSEGNNHCAGGKDRSFNFQADTGWLIDTSSIVPTCSPSSKSACYGVRNVSSNAFQYAARIANNGQCVKALGKVIARDGRGNVNGSVTWTEYRDVTRDVQQEVAKGELFWNKDVGLDLPDQTQASSLRVEQIDGSEKVITGNDLEPKWFSVVMDIVSKKVTIKPKAVDKALR